MRVAFAHYSQENDISGVTTWLFSLARRLKDDNIEVAIHFVHSDVELGSEPLALQKLRRDGIEISRVSPQSTLEAEAQQTLEFLNKWQPSIFLPQCLPAHFAAAAHAGQKGLPWALTLHSDDPIYWESVHAFIHPKDRNHIVCVSEYLRDKLIGAGRAQHAHVIPCGVAIPQDLTTFNDSPFNMVFSGRIWERQKRASLVIQTFVKACQANPAMRATMIGEGYARQSCEELVNAHGLSHAITFTGALSPNQVRPHLADCQAILLMSDFEGLPVALLEAMALGVVPVARRIPSGIPELIVHEQTGLLVSEDPKDAAHALIRLSQDKHLWRSCSEQARRLVADRYNEETSYRKWRTLLETLLHDRDSSATIRFPIDTSVLTSIPKKNPYLNSISKRQKALTSRVRQLLRTTLARVKHFVKTIFQDLF
ncbi:glycosyltransferase family 4 protein [Cyanobium gracile]|uniref:Glycosyltransferase n=1 Tax=Cyanobium gracile (strain ATCC 27147 / PCC 6307) TaxID=292564 RepID=K9P9Y2_CYAGP|nr:glycosyltransferase family 4 protein [Cyanobium gracile]AFY29541.1 glycosyltransferase [Cyanobium gracile PCC 6307]